MSIRPKGQMEDLLKHMIKLGYVKDVVIHSRMPGLKWVVTTHVQGQGTSYTSAQLDCWLDGAVAVETYHNRSRYDH